METQRIKFKFKTKNYKHTRNDKLKNKQNDKKVEVYRSLFRVIGLIQYILCLYVE